MMLRYLFPVFIMFLAFQGSASAGSLLATADGAWRGDGWFRETPGDPKRATRCALKFRYQDNTQTLTISGQCAGGGRSGNVAGRIVETSPGRYSGRWRATGGFSAGGMRGTRKGNRIRLSWRATPPNSDRLEDFSALWTIRQNQISVSFSQGSSGQSKLSSLTLRR